jgi:small conductance mechanosensitive channel
MIDGTIDTEREKRIATLDPVARYVLTVVLFLPTGMLVLAERGSSIAPILAAVGVIGIAVGFAAQRLVRYRQPASALPPP